MRFTSGYGILHNDLFVSWLSRKQQYVAASITQSEYIALSKYIRKLRFLRRMFFELGEGIKSNIVYEDSQACISWVVHEEARSKQIDVRYHMCKEGCDNGDVVLEYCILTEVMSNILTKPLKLNELKALDYIMPIAASKLVIEWKRKQMAEKESIDTLSKRGVKILTQCPLLKC